MTSKLGVFWSVMHRRPQDYDYFKRLNPTVMKCMDGGPPDYQWIRENLPNALVVARIHALSEQHDDLLKDPIGTGKRHATEWDRHANELGLDRSRTLVLGVNEPHIWEPGVNEALRQYTIALCEQATTFGLRVGAMQLSVGWPNNDGPDTTPNWSPWHGVDNAIRANNGALILHEYWADNGPGENWGWWAGRALKCPWQVPIVIGECGIDMYVKDGSVQHLSRGWRGRKTPEQYASELADYTGRMSADRRFVGCAVFASDFANGEWASFDVEPAYGAILATPIPTPTPPPTGNTIHIPAVGTGTPPVPTDDTQELPPVSPIPAGILEPRVAQAILNIESGSRTHGENGLPLIRFEAHIFEQRAGDSPYFRHDEQKPWVNQEWRRNEGDPWKPIHTGKQADEYAAFEFARTLNRAAAYNAISMGAPQIMGFNHAKIGYPSAESMYESFQNAPMQTIGFINYLLATPGMFQAMKDRNWERVALLYNGAGQVALYSGLLEKAYKELA